MRILSVGASLGRGGTERALETFSISYRRLGHDVAVLAWAAGGRRQASLEKEGIEVFVGGPSLTRAIDAADDFRPDLIHIHRIGFASADQSAILARLRTGNRRVLETNVFGRVDRSNGRDYIDVHMHLSRWCLWRWRRWLGPRRSEPIGVVVPNPVDSAQFSPSCLERRSALRAALGIPENAFVCGRVAQPDAVKWHPSIMAAFNDLATVDRGAHLVLVGLPPELRVAARGLPAKVRQRIIELPLIDSDAELADLYSSFDCFLHAARIGESFGYVLTEAMLCGCPVVTASTPHRDNSQVEVVGHLKGGVVAGSTHALSDALLHLWSDVRLRDRLKPGLPAHVISRYAAEGVSALALSIGTLVLGSENRTSLLRGIAELPGRVDRVDDAEIAALMHHTLGTPRRRELVEMGVRHRYYVQRLIDAHLKWRIDRKAIRSTGTAAEHPEKLAPRGDAATR